MCIRDSSDRRAARSAVRLYFGGAADKEDSRAGSVSDSIYLLYPGDSAAGAALFILLRDTDAAASH